MKEVVIPLDEMLRINQRDQSTANNSTQKKKKEPTGQGNVSKEITEHTVDTSDTYTQASNRQLCKYPMLNDSENSTDNFLSRNAHSTKYAILLAFLGGGASTILLGVISFCIMHMRKNTREEPSNRDMSITFTRHIDLTEIHIETNQEEQK